MLFLLQVSDIDCTSCNLSNYVFFNQGQPPVISEEFNMTSKVTCTMETYECCCPL